MPDNKKKNIPNQDIKVEDLFTLPTREEFDNFISKDIQRTSDFNSEEKENKYANDLKRKSYSIDSDLDLNRGAYEDQGYGSMWGRSVVNTAANIGLDLVETAGQLGDLQAHINTMNGEGDTYTNWLTEWATKNKNPTGEVYVNPDLNGLGETLTSGSWWLKNGASLVETATTYGLVGAGLGKGLTKGALSLAKLYGTEAMVGKVAQFGAQSVTNAALAYSEGALSGAQIYKDSYISAKDLGYSEEDANKIASESAAKTVQINTVLNTFLNVPQTSAIFRDINYLKNIDESLPRLVGESSDAYLKRLKSLPQYSDIKKNISKHTLTEMGAEATEELVNVISEDEGMYNTNSILGESKTDLLNRLGKTLKSDDAIESALLGALGGLAQPYLVKKLGDLYDKRTSGTTSDEKQAEVYDNQKDELISKLEAVQQAQTNLANASKSGNTEAYRKAQNDLFDIETYDSITKGVSEQLIDNYKEISNMSDQEAASKGFVTDTESEDYYKKKAQDKIIDINTLNKKYKDLNNKYSGIQNPELSGYPETLFNHYIGIYNDTKSIRQAERELTEVEQEINNFRNTRGTDYTISSAIDAKSNINSFDNTINNLKKLKSDIKKEQTSGVELSENRKKLVGKTYNEAYNNIDSKIQSLENNKKLSEDLLNSKFEEFKVSDTAVNIIKELSKDYSGNELNIELFKAYNQILNRNQAELDQLSEYKSNLNTYKEFIKLRQEQYDNLLTDKGREDFIKSKTKAQKEAEVKAKENRIIEKKQSEVKKKQEKITETPKPTVINENVVEEPLDLDSTSKDITTSVVVEENPFADNEGEEQSEDNNIEVLEGTVTVLDLEEGESYGEGNLDTNTLIRTAQDTANGNGGGDLIVYDNNGNIVFDNNRLVDGTNSIAYGTSSDYNEFIVNDTYYIKTTSRDLSDQLVTQKVLSNNNVLSGDLVRFEVIKSVDFKPYVLDKDWNMLDSKGNIVKTIPKGTEITYQNLLDSGHNYIPIGVYNNANELLGYIHDISYIREDRVSGTNLDEQREVLSNLRRSILNSVEPIYSYIQGTTNGYLSKNTEYSNNTNIPFIEGTLNRLSSTAIPNAKIAIAISGKAYNGDSSADEVTNLLNNLDNNPLKSGKVYAILPTKSKDNLLVQLQELPLSELPNITESLFNVIKAYYKQDKTAEDIKLLSDMFGENYRGVDIVDYIESFLFSKDLRKVTEKNKDGKDVFLTSEDDRYYISVNNNFVKFGRSGGVVYTLSNDRSDTKEFILDRLQSVLENSFLSFRREKITKFRNTSYNIKLVNNNGEVSNISYNNYEDFIKHHTVTFLNEKEITYNNDQGAEVKESVYFDNPVIIFNTEISRKIGEPIRQEVEIIEDAEVLRPTSRELEDKTSKKSTSRRGVKGKDTFKPKQNVDKSLVRLTDGELNVVNTESKAGMINPGKIDIYQQTQVLNYLTATILADIKYNNKTPKESLKELKDFFEENKDVNIDISNIIEVWDKFEQIAIDRVVNTLNNLTDLGLDLEDFYTSTEAADVNFNSFDDDSTFTNNANKSISKELKSILLSVQDGENYLGLPNYLPIDNVVNKLQAILANTTSEYSNMLNKLKEASINLPWVQEVIDTLEGTYIYNNEYESDKDREETINKFEANKEQTKIQFTRWADKYLVKMNIAIVDKNKQSYKIISANFNDDVKTVKNKWNNGLKATKLVTENNNRQYILDNVVKKQILDQYEAFVKTISNNNTLSKEFLIGGLKSLLDNIGVELDERTIANLLVSIEKGDSSLNGKKGKLTLPLQFTDRNGVFTQIFNKLKVNTLNKSDEDQEQIVTDKESLLNLNNPIFDNSGINKLAAWVVKNSNSITSNSFYDNGKTIWSYSNHKFLTKQVNNLKEDSNLIEDMLTSDFQSTSYVLQLLSNKSNGVVGKDEFRDWFNIEYVSSIKKSKGRAKELELMNNSELEIDRFISFNSISSNVERGIRKTKHIFLTTSDKKNLAVLNMFAKTPSLKFDKEGNLVGLNKETIDELLNIVNSEYKRIYNYQNSVKGNKELEQKLPAKYNEAAEVFYLFSDLNNKELPIWEEDSQDGFRLREYSESYKELSKFIESYFVALVNNKITEFKNLQIINAEGALQFVDSNYSNFTNTQLPDLLKNNITAKNNFTIADYELNNLINNLNCYQLFSGDPVNYFKQERDTKKLKKGFDKDKATVKDTMTNLGKRLAGVVAPGSQLANTKGKDIAGIDGDNYIQLLGYDQQISSNNLEYLSKILSDKDLDAYKNIDATDAQEYTTLKEHLYVMFHEGKISDRLYKDLINRINKEGDDVTLNQNELNIILQPVKPVYFNISTEVINNNFKIQKPTYIKTSSFPLLPQFTKGLEMDKLRKSMERVERKSGKLVRLVFDSGAKVGKTNNLTQVFKDRNVANDLGFAETSMLFLNRSGFRIQQEVPFDPSKEKINQGSQENKLLFTDLLDVNGFVYKGETLRGDKLRDIYLDKTKQLYDLNKRTFFDYLEVEKDQNEKIVSYNKYKLLELLEDEIKSRNLSPDFYDALEIIREKGIEVFETPLMFTNRSSKFESILISLVDSRVRKIKKRGFSSPLGSSAGIKQLSDLTEDQKLGISFLEDVDLTDGLKSMRVEDGVVKPAQVIAPFKFRDKKGNLLSISKFIKREDGKQFIDTNKLPRELLQSFGFRIPTSGLMSMSYMEIVGFVPEIMGDLLIAPEDFTKQMGSDFDIDKLYAYLYETSYDSKTGVLSKYNFDEDGYWKSYEENRDTATEDLIGGLFGELALSDSVQDEKDSLEVKIAKSKIKMLQNDLLDIHFSVLGNPSNEVQSKIHVPIGFDVLKSLANQLKSDREAKDNFNLTPLSSSYQSSKYINARGGKAGTGVFSTSNTLNTLLQGKDITYLVPKLVVTSKGPSMKMLPFNLKFEEYSNNNLSNNKTVDGGLKSLVHSAFQNASVDNEKESILENINVNSETFNAVVGLIQSGFTEEDIVVILNQPIILDYVDAMIRNNNSMLDKKVSNREKVAYDEVSNKYGFNNLSKENIDLYSEETTVIKLSDLKDILFGKIDNQQAYQLLQLNILSKFLVVNNLGKQLFGMASTLNTNSAGLPSDFFTLNAKVDKLTDLFDKKSFTNLDSLKQSINYYASDSVFIAKELLGGFFPVDNTAFQSFLNDYKAANPNFDDLNAESQASKVREMFDNFKSYIVANEFNELISKSLGTNIKAERERLMIDFGTNKSLGTIISEYIKSNKNPLVIRFEVKDNDNNIKTVTFNNSKGENLDESELYQAYIDLLNSNKVITQINGENYTEKDLARDLAMYYFINGGVFTPTSFGKFIPNKYLKEIGLNKALRNINYNNSDYFADFERQYYQNNIEDAKEIDLTEAFTRLSSVETDTNSNILAFTPLDYYGNFVRVSNKAGSKLYQYNPIVNKYQLLPELGFSSKNGFIPEFYPNKSGTVRTPNSIIKEQVNNSSFRRSINNFNFNRTVDTRQAEIVDSREDNTVKNDISKTRAVNELNIGEFISKGSLNTSEIQSMLSNIERVTDNNNKPIVRALSTALDFNKNLIFKLGDSQGNGSYSSSTNEVIIDKDLKFTRSELEHLILHELTHSVTSKAVENILGNKKEGYSKNQITAVLKLESVRNKVRGLILEGKLEQYGYTKEGLVAFDKYVESVLKGKPDYSLFSNKKDYSVDYNKYYGLSTFDERSANVKEFIAMVMSSKEFQDLLNEIPSGTKTIFNRVSEAISQILKDFLDNFKFNKDSELAESVKSIIILSNDYNNQIDINNNDVVDNSLSFKNTYSPEGLPEIEFITKNRCK
jgi:hypothetical protein